jgi:hypothetical protein
MGEDERADWLTVAMTELMRPPSIPNSYFQRACAHARRVADHPSKVVPAIFNYDPGYLMSRKSLEKELGEITAEIGNMEAARLEAPTYCTPEEARDILERFDMKSAFDVTRKPRDLKMPTPEELAEVAAQFRRQQGYDG